MLVLFQVLGLVSSSNLVFFVGSTVIVSARAPAQCRVPSLHFAENGEGNGISPGIPNGDWAIIPSDTRAALWRGLVLLRSGDSIAADLVHKAVWANAIDKFSAIEGRGVVGLGHSVS